MISLFSAIWASTVAAQHCVTTAILKGSNFDLSTGLTTQRRAPAVAYNSTDDEYLVVWFDTRNPGNNDIFGQRIAGDGSLQGSNIAIMEFADAQIDPGVAHDSIDNEYLVAWRTQQSGFFNKGRGRRVAGDGSLLGGDFLIGNGHEISIAYNPQANEFLHTARSPNINGRRVAGGGSPIGSEFVITTVGAPAPNGQVAYNGNANEFLATWRDQVSQNLQGRRISATGGLLGSPILISSTFPGSGRAASVAFDPVNDRFLVVFGVFQGTDVKAQFVSGAGALIGSNFTIATGLSSQADPHAAYSDADGLFLVVWRDGGNVVAQVLLEDGSNSGDPVTIAGSTATGSPRLAYNSTSGEFLAVWSDSRNLGLGEEDIYAQRVAVGLVPLQPGDLDCDGDADLFDYEIYLECVSGPGQTVPPGGCDPSEFANADLDDDEDVDFGDFSLFQSVYTGPGS